MDEAFGVDERTGDAGPLAGRAVERVAAPQLDLVMRSKREPVAVAEGFHLGRRDPLDPAPQRRRQLHPSPGAVEGVVRWDPLPANLAWRGHRAPDRQTIGFLEVVASLIETDRAEDAAKLFSAVAQQVFVTDEDGAHALRGKNRSSASHVGAKPALEGIVKGETRRLQRRPR